ncbi:MAG: 2TM domain-containing protein [Alphaproteobacteria bacterium]|nr:2TM domain-containing protein [Alphaproteobacteria bacterium]
MDHETLVRKKIHALKTFYTNLFIYTAVCVACIIIWVSMGGGAFWPIWVIFGCGLAAVLQAVSLGQIPKLHELFPFLSPSWEDEQIKSQLEKTDKPRNTAKYEKHAEHSHMHIPQEVKKKISTEAKKKTPKK